MRVLILGARAPVALDHARRFAAQGHTVFAADSSSCRLTSASRAVAASFRLPSPRDATAHFASELASIIERDRIDLVLPTCEEVFYLSHVRSRLPAECNVFVSPFDLLRELHSKLRFMELAAGLGVYTPRSARVGTLAEAREWAAGAPVVLKPEYSRFGVHVRLHPAGIPREAPPLPALGAWVAQEMVGGHELCSYSIAVAGELRAHVAYQPRYRLARSSSFYFDPVDVPGIREFVSAFVRKTGYTGQISFDWMVQPDRLSVLECNPRAISGLHLFGVDDPLPAAMLGGASGNLTLIQPSSLHARMISAVMLSAGLLQSVRAGSLATWWRDYRRASDVLAVPDDRLPALSGLVDMGAFARAALRARSSVREAATRDIEWDGEVLPQ